LNNFHIEIAFFGQKFTFARKNERRVSKADHETTNRIVEQAYYTFFFADREEMRLNA
jgi:hypothetical protein